MSSPVTATVDTQLAGGRACSQEFGLRQNLGRDERNQSFLVGKVGYPIRSELQVLAGV